MPQINNLPYLKERRKELRNNPTTQEYMLWSKLKNKQLLGFKFRRQHSLNHYIVDFYCPKLKLIIEVDGKIHLRQENQINDKERDKNLREMGFSILRFTNEEVELEIQSVINRIQDFIKE